MDGDDKDVFFQFEEKLLEWMGNMVCRYEYKDVFVHSNL
jgi:hypothetical protein